MFKSLAVTSSGFSRLCTPRIAQVKLSLILNTCSGVGCRIVIAVKSSPAQANFLRIRSAARGSSRRCEGTRDEVDGDRGALGAEARARVRATGDTIRERTQAGGTRERRRQFAADEDPRRRMERPELGSLPQAALGGHRRLLARAARPDPGTRRASKRVGRALQIDRKT